MSGPAIQDRLRALARTRRAASWLDARASVRQLGFSLSGEPAQAVLAEAERILTPSHAGLLELPGADVVPEWFRPHLVRAPAALGRLEAHREAIRHWPAPARSTGASC